MGLKDPEFLSSLQRLHFLNAELAKSKQGSKGGLAGVTAGQIAAYERKATILAAMQEKKQEMVGSAHSHLAHGLD